jgi:hypothetical protein
MCNRSTLVLFLAVALFGAQSLMAQGNPGASGKAGKGTSGLVAGCEPLGQSDFQTVMRRMELAKQSNDTEQMRRALNDSETLLDEIVDRMENCVAKPGSIEQQQTTGVGGFAPRSTTGGTPGEPSHGGMRQSMAPPENAPGGEGNWPTAGSPAEGLKKP